MVKKITLYAGRQWSLRIQSCLINLFWIAREKTDASDCTVLHTEDVIWSFMPPPPVKLGFHTDSRAIVCMTFSAGNGCCILAMKGKSEHKQWKDIFTVFLGLLLVIQRRAIQHRGNTLSECQRSQLSQKRKKKKKESQNWSKTEYGHWVCQAPDFQCIPLNNFLTAKKSQDPTGVYLGNIQFPSKRASLMSVFRSHGKKN